MLFPCQPSILSKSFIYLLARNQDSSGVPFLTRIAPGQKNMWLQLVAYIMFYPTGNYHIPPKTSLKMMFLLPMWDYVSPPDSNREVALSEQSNFNDSLVLRSVSEHIIKWNRDTVCNSSISYDMSSLQ